MNPVAQSPPIPAPLLRGIDVSGWQGAVDWPAVAAAGYAFGSCKLTEGLTFNDKRGLDNLAAIRTAGLRAIAYHYLRGNDPEAEAAHFLDVLGADVEALPPLLVMLDLEAPDLGSDAGQRALAWLRVVEEARGGLRPFLYTYPTFAASRHLDRFPDLAAYPLWIADYRGREAPEVPKPWGDWALWQASAKHRAPGVAVPCDLDVARAEWL